MLIALVPAYNEEKTIVRTIQSLLEQTVVPDVIRVIVNNSTDSTFDVASFCADVCSIAPDCPQIMVFDLGKVPDKKAGALNWYFETYLQDFSDSDYVLVVDGDSTLSPNFCEEALRAHDNHNTLGGVGGKFLGRETSSLLGYLQSMEYYRYGNTFHRMANRAFVLSGTASMFKWSALRNVRHFHKMQFGREEVYDTHSLTEDNEITLALQVCGWDVKNLSNVSAETDVMEGVKDLSSQRTRWYLGALRNISSYGRLMPWWMRWYYWRQQIGLVLSALSFVMYSVLLTVGLFADTVTLSPIWILPGVVVAAERLYTVWGMGKKARWIAGTLVVEQAYSILLLGIYIKALFSFLKGSKGKWVAT